MVNYPYHHNTAHPQIGGCMQVATLANRWWNVPDEVINDTAALAARQPKSTGGVVKVSSTRCRNVSKPPGAKPGLVYLNGAITIVKVNMNEAKKSLERLDKTVLVN